MSVETATYINQLNAAWPQSTDFLSEGDNHIRLSKDVLKKTFPNVAGAVTPTHTELNSLAGLTGGTIQSQLAGKADISGETYTGAHVFTGTVTLPAATSVGLVSQTELGYLDGVTSAIQAQIDSKASLNGATYTGTHNFNSASVSLPATTSIGGVSNVELGYLDGVTGPVQGQLDGKVSKSGDTYTGTHNLTGATVTVPTVTAGDATTKAASTAFVAAAALAASLPGQTGNAGKVITTNGTAASWADHPSMGVFNGFDWGSVRTSPFTASVNVKPYPVDSETCTNIVFPMSKAVGDKIWVIDALGKFKAYPLLIYGGSVGGAEEVFTCDMNNLAVCFEWTGSTWKPYL